LGVHTGPLFISSGDLVADRRYQWALEYLARGDRAAAAEILEQVLTSAPTFAAAAFALGDIREAEGDRERALAAFRAARDADPHDYHGARLRLARLGEGEVTRDLMQRHVRRLFDQHAPKFEESLLQQLSYRGPQLLYAAIMAVRAAADAPARFAAMLDLGCGTGLAGVSFRPVVDSLAGVDLSAAMIAEAGKKGVYDRLEVAELGAFLAAEATSTARYDLIVAADVLVYVADLAAVAVAVRAVLAAGGLFAFTVETHSGEGVRLGESLRYAHGETHVRGAIADAGHGLVQLSAVSTRTERGEPVPGLLAIATAC
jgi:predicted TPR repeat methyltransferase